MVECKVVDPDVEDFPCFSGYLFAVLIYYFEKGDVGTGQLLDSLWTPFALVP